MFTKSSSYLIAFLISILAFVYPLILIPILGLGVFNRNDYAIIPLAVIFGVLAAVLVPYSTMDIVRYYALYNSLSYESFSYMLSEHNRIFSLFITLILWLMSNIGLPKEVMPFLVGFLSTLYLLKSFYILHKYLLDKKYSDKHEYSLSLSLSVTFFILFILVFRYIETVSGIRSGLAGLLFFYGSLLFILFNKKKYFFFYSMLAIAIHLFILIPFLLVIIVYFLKFNFSQRLAKLLISCSLIVMIFGLSNLLFQMVIGLLEPYLRSAGLYFPAYMDPNGIWGGGYFDDKNIKTIIFEKYLKPSLVWGAGISFLFFTGRFYKNLKLFLVLFFIFLAIMSASRTFFDRYSIIFLWFYLAYLFLEFSSWRSTRKFLLFILCFIILIIANALANFYKYRDIYSVSWIPLLYRPAFIVIMDGVSKDEYIIRE